jgi:uncharacterized protein (TIGR03437 family)
MMRCVPLFPAKSLALTPLLLLSGNCLLAQPAIRATNGVLNAASYAQQGMPNSAIAEGSTFTVFGTGLGPATVQFVVKFPVSATLAGTSVNVTAGGKTVQAPMLFTLASQVAAVMPSTTPVGPATISVSYNGAQSQEYPIQVVASSFGTFAVSAQGTGTGVIADVNNHIFLANSAALAGDVAIIWGTGLGPVPYDDAEPPRAVNLTNIPVQLFVGDQLVPPIYQGPSGCCAGINEIAFRVPSGITGCYVPVEVSINGIVSPTTTMPIAAGPERVCSDPNGMPAGMLKELLSKPSFKIGVVDLLREVQLGFPTSDVGSGWFHTFTPLEFAGTSFFQEPPVGTCIVNALSVQDLAFPLASIPALDAGPSINVGAEKLTKSDPGTYSTPGLPKPFLPPGLVTVNGTGGANVGAFSVSVTDPSPVTWTNVAAGNTLDRASGATITWTGGMPGTFVAISGGVALLNPSIDAVFHCVAAAAQGSFTIPPHVLLQLPASSKNAPGVNMWVGAFEPYTSFTAPGLDYGYVTSGVATFGYATLQ